MHTPSGERHGAGVDVAKDAFGDALNALPRDCDLPCGMGYFIGATQRAEQMQAHRKYLAKHLARSLLVHLGPKIEAEILKLIERGDTIKGYSPEEYAEMVAHGLQP